MDNVRDMRVRVYWASTLELRSVKQAERCWVPEANSKIQHSANSPGCASYLLQHCFASGSIGSTNCHSASMANCHPRRVRDLDLTYLPKSQTLTLVLLKPEDVLSIQVGRLAALLY